MIACKLARLRFGLEQGFPPEVLRDSIVDAAGYLDCLYGILERERENLRDFRDRLDRDASEGDLS